MPPRENRFIMATGDTQPPDLRGTKSGRFEKHAMHAAIQEKLDGFCATGNIKQLAVWREEIVKWHHGGTIILEFDEWKLVPEHIRDIESPERCALLLMLGEDPFPSIGVIRMAINIIIELQEITEWTKLSPTTKQNLIYDLLKSIIESRSVSKLTIIEELTKRLTDAVMSKNTLPLSAKDIVTIPAPPEQKQ